MAREIAGLLVKIRIGDFDQLKAIAWNRSPSEEIEEAEAFNLYETNWRLVDQSAISDQERDLIERLKNEHGNGLMNV